VDRVAGLCGSVHSVCFRQEVDRVNDAQHVTLLPCFSCNLQQTAGVTGGDRICAGIENVLKLSLRETFRHLRLRQIVGPCRTAAELTFDKFYELKAGDLT